MNGPKDSQNAWHHSLRNYTVRVSISCPNLGTKKVWRSFEEDTELKHFPLINLLSKCFFVVPVESLLHSVCGNAILLLKITNF